MNTKLSIDDVLIEWWKANPDARYLLNYNTARVTCRTCTITWMRALGGYEDNGVGIKIEYALEPNGKVQYLDPADPDLFEKMNWVLKNVRHDKPGCPNT